MVFIAGILVHNIIMSFVTLVNSLESIVSINYDSNL